MLVCLVLIEGETASADAIRSVSLGNAKQLVVGTAYGFGIVVHIAAESREDLDRALRDFTQVKGVTGVLTMALRAQP